jgi:tetratricopeptide (TPR) repeat protein
VVISAVSGTGGVGKTALAVHWAHRVAGQFPDGQLYLNLRGYDPEAPVTAGDALASFLGALGVTGADVPLDLDERAARYRTAVAGRRMLIVLDNAATVQQVRPLLPGTPGAMVVVTSRDSLAGLVALHGARRLDLDLLPRADALDLLRDLVGARVEAEPEAAATLAVQCARLPLALRVAAELAAARPAAPLSDLVAELAQAQRRLDLLDAGGDPRAAVRAVFSWSVRHLPAPAARAFRLLGLHPGPDTDAYAAAALTGTGVDGARSMLDLLARAHLVHPTGAGRYGMHDLLRAYAAVLAAEQDAEPERRAAVGRLLDYYLAAAAAAVDRMHPAEAGSRPRVAPPGTPIPALADADAGLAWLDIERASLVAVAAHAAAHGRPDHTVRLAATLYRYLAGGHPTDALAIHGHARTAARHAADPAAEAQALTGLGVVHGQLGEHERAAGSFEEALALFRRAGDPVGQARALGNLGTVQERLGRYGPAAGHLRHALALFRQAGDEVGEARALTGLGTVETRLGGYEPAAEHHRQAMALFRRAGDRSGEARALTSLGTVEARLGRYRQAAEHHRQALILYRQAGNRYGQAWALDSLGAAHTHLGRPDRATEHHQQALTLFRQTGDRDGEPSALNGLGEAARAAGHPTDAIARHADALAAAGGTGARDQQARAHTGLGHAHRSLANPARAREHLQHALALYTELGAPETDEVRAHLAVLEQPPQPRRRLTGSPAVRNHGAVPAGRPGAIRR